MMPVNGGVDVVPFDFGVMVRKQHFGDRKFALGEFYTCRPAGQGPRHAIQFDVID